MTSPTPVQSPGPGPVARGSRIAVATAVAVVLGGGATIGTLFFGSAPSSPSTSPASTTAPSATFSDPGGSAVVSVALGPNGTLVTVGQNGTSYAFNRTSRRPVRILRLGGTAPRGTILSLNGRALANPVAGCLTGAVPCRYRLVDVATERQVAAVNVADLDGASVGDSRLAFINSAGVGAEVVDLPSGKVVANLTDPTRQYADSTGISRNGMVLAVSCQITGPSHTVYIWNVAAKTVTATLTVPGAMGSAQVGSAAVPLILDQDGKTVALSDGIDTDVYDVATANLISTMPVALKALSSSGTLIAAIDPTDGAKVQVWDVKTAKPIKTLFVPGGRGGRTTIAFSPDNQSVAVGYAHGTAAVWDLTGSNQLEAR